VRQLTKESFGVPGYWREGREKIDWRKLDLENVESIMALSRE
jgi:hypothetical protein